MPHPVPLYIALIAGPSIQIQSMTEWLKTIGVDDRPIQDILNCPEKTNAEILIELAGRRCYKSFQVGLNPNVTRIRKDIADYIENILKAKHGSVLEHASFTFAIENVSRVFTGEMNRHRAGTAISEASMRYIAYEDIGFWMPLSISNAEDDSPELRYKKQESRKIFIEAFTAAENFYGLLKHIWRDELAPESKFKAKKEITSMMRRIIPMGVATGGLWTGNVRALRHICEMRCSPAAEEEIACVASKMLELLSENEPNLFGDFKATPDGFAKPEYSKV